MTFKNKKAKFYLWKREILPLEKGKVPLKKWHILPLFLEKGTFEKRDEKAEGMAIGKKSKQRKKAHP